MAEPHHVLDALGPEQARLALERCCGSTRWVEAMLARRPYGSAERLESAVAACFLALTADDYLEAFSHHPRIGEELASLRERYRSTATWASAEQAGVRGASEATLRALAAANRSYEARFGFPFIVCATGKSADEMLSLLSARMAHELAEEREVAAAEQRKITQLRLEKLT